MNELLSSLILLFPAHYEASRLNFRGHCNDPQAQCFRFELPDEPELSVDAIVFEPTAPVTKALVLVSGTHGVEGPAGAAVQRLLIEKYRERFLDKNYRLILVHALNPWGFAYGRRGTQKNVDLNRNFPSDGDSTGDVNPGYAKMAQVLGGENLTGIGLWERIKFSAKMFWPLISFQMSFDELNQAVAGGQREFPRGLFFGGTTAEPQVEWLGDLLDKQLEAVPEALIMDLHTGLGDKGTLHLMTSDAPLESAEDLRRRIFPPTGPQDGECLKDHPCSSIYKSTSGQTKGFYSVAGDFLDFAEDFANGERKIAAFTMEFGTRGTGLFAQLDTLFIMACENASYQAEVQRLNAWPTAERERAENSFIQLFNPEDPSWRDAVMTKSSKMFERILEAF